MRAGSPALFFSLALVCLPALGSKCLLETAPEVGPHVVSGDRAAVEQAVAALDDRAGNSDPSVAAPWLTAQASMLLDIGEMDAARALLEQAIRGWMFNRRVDAEICARHLLAFGLALHSMPRAALAETLLAEERARDAGLTDQLNHLRQTRVTLLLTLNERLEEGLMLLDQIDPGDSTIERVNWHHIKGLMLGRLNRHNQAAAEFEQQLRLAEQQALGPIAATARFNLANQLEQIDPDTLDPGRRERVITLHEKTIADPHARPATRALALRSLANLRPADERESLLMQCVEAAEQVRDKRRMAVCLADMARLALDHDQSRAHELMGHAVALSADDPRTLWQIQAQRLDLIWASHPPPEAFTASLEATAGEQILRQRQMAGPERARLLDGLMRDYRHLANRAYAHAEEFPDLLTRAFELLESNRAQVLRERQLQTRQGTHDDAIKSLAARINRAQRRLVTSDDFTEAQALRRKLDGLEIEWKNAVTGEPGLVESLRPGPSQAELQARLGPHEALLSFLTRIPDNNGQQQHGWLQVVTHDQSRVYPVPDHLSLTTAGGMLEGLENRQSITNTRLLHHLGRQLLGAALGDLPDRIRHLIVVPDSGLEVLPLEVLPTPDFVPVGLQYSLDYAPSAAIWHSASQGRPHPGRILVLADPALPGAGYQALDAAFPDSRPGRLPGAAGEARQIRRIAGPRTTSVYTGAGASEALLRATTLPVDTRLIHFATHALIHPEFPERSAVLLAAGAEDADGLLQPREIEWLPLENIAVVLATCASATGQVLDAEGVMNLARSFLIAGAPAVIATRWPIDDHHAHAFFARVYRHLAGGSTLTEAMRQARVDLYNGDFPEQAWAAYVLYGNGSWRPIRPTRRWPAVALVLLGLILTAIFVSQSWRKSDAS